jgi:hypothetical protein
MKKVSSWIAMRKTAMAYRPKKELAGGATLEAGCRLVDEYVEHSTPFNNYNTL